MCPVLWRASLNDLKFCDIEIIIFINLDINLSMLSILILCNYLQVENPATIPKQSSTLN